MKPSKDEVKTMPDALSVRTGQEKDIDTLVKHNIALAQETEQKRLSPPIVTQGVQMLLKNPQLGFYVVAELTNEVVGSCMVTYEWSDWRCSLFWWIQSVYVKYILHDSNLLAYLSIASLVLAPLRNNSLDVP